MSDFSKASASLYDEGVGIKSFQAAVARPNWLSRKMLADLISLYDILAILLSAWAAYYFYIELLLETPIDKSGYTLVAIIAAAFFYAIAQHRGQYNKQADFRFAPQMSALIFVCALTLPSAFAAIFFLKIQTEFSRIWVLLWGAFLLILLAAGRALMSQYTETLMRKGLLRRSVALVGAGPQFEVARSALLKEKHHISLVCALDLSAPNNASPANSSGNIQSFIMDAQNKHVDGVIIALPSTMAESLETVMEQVQILPVDIEVYPDFGGARVQARQLHKIGDLSVITTVSKPIAEWGAFLKSVEDYVLGLACLALFLPAMAVIAIAVKLDSKGPVFFRQRRHGYNHQVIEVVKFRTMTVMEDGETVKQATRNDKRVTRVGAFLRRSSLDELPQFWNVVRGEMSIVGPRPHALAHNTYYGNLIEKYANRHRVKPGITGWAQVNGFRGETTDPDMMAERVRYDLDYIENWSIWLDLKIVLMTPLFGFFRRSAY
jgi:putative colanic acid biosynthesis UDP-glucose lipid carrier transferase